MVKYTAGFSSIVTLHKAEYWKLENSSMIPNMRQIKEALSAIEQDLDLFK